MVDTTDNGFRAAIQSLREIVLPAVDPAHPMAREQIALVIDWLEFQRLRTPQLADRQRAELSANLAVARAIAELDDAPGAAGVTGAMDGAERVLGRPDATYPDLLTAREQLEDALSATVRQAADLPSHRREAIEQSVVRGSAAIVALQRAWFLPYGLEADPAAIPSLVDALAAAHEDIR